MASIPTFTSTELEVPKVPTLQLRGGDHLPDWLVRLREEGWAVVPEVVSREKAAKTADAAYSWVEGWGLGFDRNDKSTHTKDRMHLFYKGGLTNRYGVGHEQWIWDIKQDPELIEKFEEIYGTKDLLVSYDGANISVPLVDRKEDDEVFAPWAHVDQSPLVHGLYCVQGIINLAPNGPEDGGLMVLKGSSKLYKELFAAFEPPEKGWNRHDRHDHTPEQIKWLEDHGCQWEKVCAEPGDLLLWDSRTVHYGATPKAQKDRLAVCKLSSTKSLGGEAHSVDVCYTPESFASEDTKQRRLQAWKDKCNTSHNPNSFWRVEREVPEDHPTYEIAMKRPLQDPVLTARGRQLVGLDPY